MSEMFRTCDESIGRSRPRKKSLYSTSSRKWKMVLTPELGNEQTSGDDDNRP